ncbi:unnamed protein product [Prorocentrum cordatum]|uniref:Uncharacterized protein n=1 Tax=Prorocentrum cordatum TaxID=2364126 RepID=A0ABN9THL3_9DINO|nr:unnamed protein product [Polarella glacialis]
MPDGSRSSLLTSAERCCAHSTPDTLEGLARAAGASVLEVAGACPPRLRWACRAAENRTARARGTLARVRRQLALEGSRSEAAGAIPVLGWPVAFDPAGLSLRLLRSIDFPVQQLVLVASGPAAHLQRLLRRAQELRADVRVVQSAQNLGCAGGWNEVIGAVPEAPWWLVASHDVAFPPGALSLIAARTEAALRRESRGGPLAPGLRSFAIRGQSFHAITLPAFVLTRRAVAAAGLFDENFWPAYAEDLDFLQRLRLAGGSRSGAASLQDRSVEIVHGPEGWTDGVHYSGIEQFAVEPLARAPRDDEGVQWYVGEQLRAANNYHLRPRSRAPDAAQPVEGAPGAETLPSIP